MIKQILVAYFYIANEIEILLPRDKDFERIILNTDEDNRNAVVLAWLELAPSGKLNRSILYLQMMGELGCI